MLTILLTILFSILSYIIIQKKQIGQYTKQSKLCIQLTIPIISLLYSSLLSDVIGTELYSTRKIIFTITIICCIILLLIIYPIFILNHFGFEESSIIGVIIQFVLVYTIGNFIPTNESIFSLYGLMGKVAIMGMFLSSVFSGISTISIPMQILEPFHRKYSIEEYQMKNGQLRLMQQKHDTQSKEYRKVQKEFVMISKSLKVSKKRKGIKGMYNLILGGIMTFYSLFRLYNCIFHLLGLKRKDGTSWVSKFMNLLTNSVHINIDWNIVGYFLSFFMIGMLVMTGVKGILSKAFKIIMSFERTQSKELKGSVIVVVCYFVMIHSLSFMINSRSHLLDSPKSVIYNSFGEINYNSYTWFSDLTFLISAIISFGYYYLKNRYGLFLTTNKPHKLSD